MKTIIIVAMTPDRLIGKDGGMPWHEPADLKHFKRTTKNHAVIMGRRTYESLGRPLPRRRNIVITRNQNPAFPAPNDLPEGTSLDIVYSLDEAFALCSKRKEEKAFIIGGAQIYALAFPMVDEMIVTYIDRDDLTGDTWFPEWNEADWIATPQESESHLRIVHYARAQTHRA